MNAHHSLPLSLGLAHKYNNDCDRTLVSHSTFFSYFISWKIVLQRVTTEWTEHKAEMNMMKMPTKWNWRQRRRERWGWRKAKITIIAMRFRFLSNLHFILSIFSSFRRSVWIAMGEKEDIFKFRHIHTTIQLSTTASHVYRRDADKKKMCRVYADAARFSLMMMIRLFVLRIGELSEKKEERMNSLSEAKC